jgi:hypothetical protein
LNQAGFDNSGHVVGEFDACHCEQSEAIRPVLSAKLRNVMKLNFEWAAQSELKVKQKERLVT